MKTLGRYQIEGELGKGAMGIVYRASDPNIGRPLAIKTLRLADPNAEDADELRERFKREARAAGLLDHPTIVKVHDFDEDKETLFIAMELLDGVDLAAILKASGRMEPSQAINILAQVAEGLDYAHAKGTIHRDIKPANVVLTSSGEVKITDFGIAKLETGDQLTQVGSFLGTPSYTAPEQLEGKKVDGSVDIYSLAAMAYELLSGKRPFTGRDFTTLSYKIVNLPPPTIEGLEPKVTEALAHGMAKSPSDRPVTATGFVEELATALNLPMPTRSPSGRFPSQSAQPSPPSPPVPPPSPVGPPPTRVSGPTPRPSEVTTEVRADSRSRLLPVFVGAAVIAFLAITAIAIGLFFTLLKEDLGPTPGPPPTPGGATTPATAPFDPTHPDNPKATVNLTVYDVGSGTATLVLDGRDFKTFEVQTRSDFSQRVRGYVRTRVPLPIGKHQISLKVSADRKLFEGQTITIDLKPRDRLELRATLEGRTGAMTTEVNAPRR